MKPIAIIAIIAAVVVVGGACAGVAFSGVLNGGTTGPGGDNPVVPTDPVEPTPTETPTETPTPTPTETQMSTFAPMTSSGSSSSSGSNTPQHVHTYSDAWTNDTTTHWHAATCGHNVIKDEAAHVYGESFSCVNGGTCTICEYNKVAGEHVWGEWVTTQNENEYSRTCSNCPVTETETFLAAIDQTYYATLNYALKNATAGQTVTILATGTHNIDCTDISELYLDNIIIEGAVDGIVLKWEGTTHDKYQLIIKDGTSFKNVAFADTIVMTGYGTFEDVTFEKGIGYSKIEGNVILTDCIVKATSEGFAMKLLEGTRDDISISATGTTFEGGVQIQPCKADTTKGMTTFTRCQFSGTHVWKNTHITSNNPITLTDCTFSTDADHTSNVYLANDMPYTAATVTSGEVLVSFGANSESRTILTICERGIVVTPETRNKLLGDSSLIDGATYYLKAGSYTSLINDAWGRNITILGEEGAIFTNDVQLGGGKNVKVEGLTIQGHLVVYGEQVLVTKNTAKSIWISGGNSKKTDKIEVTNNIIDGTDETDSNDKYNLYILSYADEATLSITGNEFKNSYSHAIAVQGSGTGYGFRSIDVSGNTFVNWGTNGENDRGAFKIWEDTNFAPSKPNSADEMTDSMKSLAESIKSTNTFKESNCECICNVYGFVFT